MQDFQNLRVWREAQNLALDLYRWTTAFPDGERYGLTAQMRRAGNSIGANIAEGSCRGSPRDFVRFLYIAAGSAAEVESFSLLARDLGYLECEVATELLERTRDIKRMLTGLIASISAKQH